jgi:uncharacterized repeat protein (TIGR04138 family)
VNDEPDQSDPLNLPSDDSAEKIRAVKSDEANAAEANPEGASARDGYAPEAFAFVGESLRHAVLLFGKEKLEGEQRHLTARELIEGVLDLAISRFGLLAELVLREWGIRESEDVGRITFALIELGIFSKQPSDSLEDFRHGPHFARTLTALSHKRLVSSLA